VRGAAKKGAQPPFYFSHFCNIPPAFVSPKEKAIKKIFLLRVKKGRADKKGPDPRRVKLEE
jgi:hypothetical protein